MASRKRNRCDVCWAEWEDDRCTNPKCDNFYLDIVDEPPPPRLAGGLLPPHLAGGLPPRSAAADERAREVAAAYPPYVVQCNVHHAPPQLQTRGWQPDPEPTDRAQPQLTKAQRWLAATMEPDDPDEPEPTEGAQPQLETQRCLEPDDPEPEGGEFQRAVWALAMKGVMSTWRYWPPGTTHGPTRPSSGCLKAAAIKLRGLPPEQWQHQEWDDGEQEVGSSWPPAGEGSGKGKGKGQGKGKASKGKGKGKGKASNQQSWGSSSSSRAHWCHSSWQEF